MLPPPLLLLVSLLLPLPPFSPFPPLRLLVSVWPLLLLLLVLVWPLLPLLLVLVWPLLPLLLVLLWLPLLPVALVFATNAVAAAATACTRTCPAQHPPLPRTLLPPACPRSIEAISYMLTQQLATQLVAQGKGREHRRRSAGGGIAAAPKL